MNNVLSVKSCLDLITIEILRIKIWACFYCILYGFELVRTRFQRYTRAQQVILYLWWRRARRTSTKTAWSCIRIADSRAVRRLSRGHMRRTVVRFLCRAPITCMKEEWGVRSRCRTETSLLLLSWPVGLWRAIASRVPSVFTLAWSLLPSMTPKMPENASGALSDFEQRWWNE